MSTEPGVRWVTLGVRENPEAGMVVYALVRFTPELVEFVRMLLSMGRYLDGEIEGFDELRVLHPAVTWVTARGTLADGSPWGAGDAVRVLPAGTRIEPADRTDPDLFGWTRAAVAPDGVRWITSAEGGDVRIRTVPVAEAHLSAIDRALAGRGPDAP